MTDPTRRQVMQMADEAGITDHEAAVRLVRRAFDVFRPAPAAEGKPGPSIEELGPLIAWLSEKATQAADSGSSREAGMLTWALQVVGECIDEDAAAPAAAEQRQAAPVPVPVSERLPGGGGLCAMAG